MSREFTFFRFDVDEDAVRSVLASIPGVEPVPADERDPAETGRAETGSPASDAEAGRAADGVDDARSTDADVGRTDEPVAGVRPNSVRTGSGDDQRESAGAEAHLDDSADESRPTATTWTRPSTPWPGAPTGEPDEDEGIVARLKEKKLLIGGAAAALSVVGAVAVWFLKFRDGSSGGDAGGGGRPGARRDPTPDEPHADDAESREYPVDAAPVVGMAFLAVASVLLRRFGGERETDRPPRTE